ncbi:hypothetical protein SpCBS45565_g02552 [Spizellomyces sp. 'palustris']|nr:hypothetical protein SpCBS45565_g02552 [Spizellomyces sp. 'palustris']
MNFIYDLTRRLFNTPGPEQMSASKELVENAIKENKVVVFSKSYCPYCKKAKKLLDSLGVKYALFELDERPDGQAIQEYLKEKTGQRTVPNIFINGQHIGGCDDLHAAQDSGKLQKLLDQGDCSCKLLSGTILHPVFNLQWLMDSTAVQSPLASPTEDIDLSMAIPSQNRQLTRPQWRRLKKYQRRKEIRRSYARARDARKKQEASDPVLIAKRLQEEKLLEEERQEHRRRYETREQQFELAAAHRRRLEEEKAKNEQQETSMVDPILGMLPQAVPGDLPASVAIVCSARANQSIPSDRPTTILSPLEAGRLAAAKFLESLKSKTALSQNGIPSTAEESKEHTTRSITARLDEEPIKAPGTPQLHSLAAELKEKSSLVCAYHQKTGSCRFAEFCKLRHPEPTIKNTLVLKNMFQFPANQTVGDEEYTDEDEYFSAFYEDVHGEFAKIGRLTCFMVCRNEAVHLRGSVYVQYAKEEDAICAHKIMDRRWFGGRQLECEFVPIIEWNHAVCGHYERGRCTNPSCNFLHAFPNPGGMYRICNRGNTGGGSMGAAKVKHNGHGAQGTSDPRSCEVKDPSRETQGDMPPRQNAIQSMPREKDRTTEDKEADKNAANPHITSSEMRRRTERDGKSVRKRDDNERHKTATRKRPRKRSRSPAPRRRRSQRHKR